MMAGIILFTISILCVIAGIMGRSAAKYGSPFKWRGPKERKCSCGGDYMLVGTGDNAAIFQCTKCGEQLRVSLEFIKSGEKNIFTIREVISGGVHVCWKTAIIHPDTEGKYLVVYSVQEEDKCRYKLNIINYLGDGIWENEYNETILFYFDSVIPEFPVPIK